jgi:hypothetical protein
MRRSTHSSPLLTFLSMACLTATCRAFVSPQVQFGIVAKLDVASTRKEVKNIQGTRHCRVPLRMSPYINDGGTDENDSNRNKKFSTPTRGRLKDLDGGSKLLGSQLNDEEIDLGEVGSVPNTKEERVKVFGAWMDSTVAGRDTLDQMDGKKMDKLESELYSRYLKETNNDMKKTKELVAQHKAKLVEADKYFRDGVKKMVSGRMDAKINHASLC